MPALILERAVSGRSRCCSSQETIQENDWRVGIKGFRGGFTTTIWYLPKPFLSSVFVEYAGNGRSKCKGDDTVIAKGEVRVAFMAGTSKSYYRPSQAAPHLRDVAEIVAKEAGGGKVFDFAALKGMPSLEEAHRRVVLRVLRGDKAAAKEPNPTNALKEGTATAAGGKAKAKKLMTTTTSKKRKAEAKVEEDEEEEEEEEDEALELVWAKNSTDPWWPGFIAEPGPEHLKQQPAALKALQQSSLSASSSGLTPTELTELTLVVFFGARPSWAWVFAATSLVPFDLGPSGLNRAKYASRCKTSAFKKALKQADDQARRQSVKNDDDGGGDGDDDDDEAPGLSSSSPFSDSGGGRAAVARALSPAEQAPTPLLAAGGLAPMVDDDAAVGDGAKGEDEEKASASMTKKKRKVPRRGAAAAAVKDEEGDDDANDDEEDEEDDDGLGLSDYEKVREANIARNHAMLDSLGLNDATSALQHGSSSRGGSSSSQRGLRAAGNKEKRRQAREAASAGAGERRRSGRVAGDKAPNLFVSHEGRGGAVTVGGDFSATDAAGAEAGASEGSSSSSSSALSAEAEARRALLREGPLSLAQASHGGAAGTLHVVVGVKGEGGAEATEAEEEGVKTKTADALFVESLNEIAKQSGDSSRGRTGKSSSGSKNPPLNDGDDGDDDHDDSCYRARIGRLRVKDENVAKVTTDRAYGLAVMPSSSHVVCAVGDRSGNLGVWNYSSQHLYPDTDGVTQFSPHTATVNVVAFHPTNPSKVFTTSYDGTVRCLDLNHQVFESVYNTSQRSTYDFWLQHSCLTPNGNGLIAGDSEGDCVFVDLRSPKNRVVWRGECHDKKVQTVSVHPQAPHFLATASLDRSVKIFDLRKVAHATTTGSGGSGGGGGSDGSAVLKPLCTFAEGNSVNCAYWNPTGEYLLSVTQGDHLRVFHKPHTHASGDHGAGVAAAVTVHHDNKTGRYLPVFHAAWDPKKFNSFVVGSMAKTRCVEVFGVSSSSSSSSSSASLPISGNGKDKKNKSPKASSAASAAAPLLACRKVATLSGTALASVQSRLAFHPHLDVLVCANASGRVHIFD